MTNNGLMIDVRSRENNSSHRTRDMDRDRLIVRRGRPFTITAESRSLRPGLDLDRDLDQDLDRDLDQDLDLDLVLHLGQRDEVELVVQQRDGDAGRHGDGGRRGDAGRRGDGDAGRRGDGDGWWFTQRGAQGETLVTVHSPPDAIVGFYRLTVTASADGRQETTDVHFHLLFNPWCTEDAVFLPDERQLQEYVMNEDGIIYTGEWDNITTKPWNYGQFEDRVLDVCFEVLDKSTDAVRDGVEDLERRRDPVYVGRVISGMVNAHGDRGVLMGNWTDSYAGGVAPTRWTGSVAILQQWSREGGDAVRYAQCWVFAGVACTVLRCLGIPTRVVTNFLSVHDVDGNLSLDVLLDERLEDLERRTRGDSIWNFHVWVESWMRRDDLPEGNHGWQVLDPTPQELSQGEFRCGPFPVAAVKEGNLDVAYDGPYVFAEVNADIVRWIVYRDGRREKLREDQRTVGRNVSTKSVFGDFREDLTLSYKYPEGSRREREVYQRAGRRISEPTNQSAEPGRLTLSIKHARPVFGTDFDVIVEVKNTGSGDVGAELTYLVTAVTYNSLPRGECKRAIKRVTVPAHGVHQEVLRLLYSDYAVCVSADHVMRVGALLKVTGVGEPVMTTTNISLTKPEITVQVPGKSTVGDQVTALLSFTNPLPVPLRGGVFTVEGGGLVAATQIHVTGELGPGRTVSAQLSFTPRRAGVRKLLVDFDSDRLMDVKGVATLVVRKKYNPRGYTVPVW